MTDQLKFIIKEINDLLGGNYDLIKFDALPEQKLLQILVDVLAKYETGESVDIEESDPETISVQVLEMLSNIKYKPPSSIDGSEYRVKLLTGDRFVITGILQWIFTHKDQVKKTAYLAKFLKSPAIPNEIQGNRSIQELLESHNLLAEEFKEAHKRLRLAEKATANSTEMMNDIKEMAIERDIVVKRLENIQVNLINIPEKEELVNISRALREQQEKQSTLESQRADQEEQLKKASDQLQRYLNVFHGQAMIPKSADDVMKQIQDEIQLNCYLVKEKLPQDLKNAQKDLSIVQQSADGNLTRQDLQSVQVKIDRVKSEIETLTKQKMATVDAHTDKLNPFRQQAASIRRNKEAAAEKLHQITFKLREKEATLAELNYQVKQLLGENVLRGEEMKKYVSKLKTRSVTYKKQRAKLAAHKVETGILSRTLYVLSSLDPTIEMALVHHAKIKFDDKQNNATIEKAKNESPNDLSQLVVKTTKKIASLRKEMLPLSEKLIPLRQEFQNVQQEYEQKKRAYDSTSINISAQMEPLTNQIKSLNERIQEKEGEWKVLRQQLEKAMEMQTIVEEENQDYMSSPRRPSKMDSLHKKMRALESTVSELKQEQQQLSDKRSMVEEQTQIWNNVAELLASKLKCRQNNKAKSEQITITHRSQTLILQ